MVIHEGDETNASNATVTTSSSSYTANTGSYYSTDYCYNRLPCGYCTRLDRPCPMMGNTTIYKTGTYPGYDPDWWKKVTCNEAPKVTYNNVTTTTTEGNNG